MKPENWQQKKQHPSNELTSSMVVAFSTSKSDADDQVEIHQNYVVLTTDFSRTDQSQQLGQRHWFHQLNVGFGEKKHVSLPRQLQFVAVGGFTSLLRPLRPSRSSRLFVPQTELRSALLSVSCFVLFTSCLRPVSQMC